MKMRTDKKTPPAGQQEPEREAVAQLKQGNPAGLAVLVQKYQVKAVHAAILITCDRGTAEEVVQETFLRVYKKINQFDENRPFGPWFLRSVINAAIKTTDQQKKFQVLEEESNENFPPDWLFDPALDPQEIFERKEMREALWQAIRQLTPDQRSAVVLRYFLDMNEQEMIQELDRPLSTVKWWLYAARQRLRQMLKPLNSIELERQETKHE